MAPKVEVAGSPLHQQPPSITGDAVGDNEQNEVVVICTACRQLRCVLLANQTLDRLLRCQRNTFQLQPDPRTPRIEDEVGGQVVA
ncbi:hypothetical protein EV646_111303 [Kribbella antiqua]|uniref:Uncharacterized protein n=1 Tax=Kribbella antiqua TaxID=2512217 RepID=A0A4R2IJU6_9ACTN|nr:hypothetical protein EV646_111303 [Kribbella antiqua]